MKRLLTFALVLAMMLSLAACGGNTDNNVADDTTTTTTTEGTTTTTATEGTTTAPTTEGTTQTAPTTTTTTAAPTTTTTTEDNGWGDWEDPIPPETTATTTTTVVDNRPEIKILSIGHSFSVDAMRTYMWELFEAAGYKTTIAYLYYPSCSLEQQYHYITENKAAYEQYCKNTNGRWVVQYNARALTALWDEDWDIVTFQPDPDFGKGTMTYNCEWGCGKKVNDYDHFNEMVTYVKNLLIHPSNPHGPNTDVKLYYHLTWAFASDCKLWCYAYSNFDQMTMYNDFWAATKKYVMPNKNIAGVIPCITSIQNARTSFMGDTFNEPSFDANGKEADGYHLNDKGDLVAAMTWVAYFTGKSPLDFKITIRDYTDQQYNAMAEAVDNAIKNPQSVTESTFKN